MAKKIALGGKRLGSGAKIDVELKEFGRSTHDQGMVFTTDMTTGTLVPAYCQIITRGDTINFENIESIVRTLPTNGPVFGSFKQQIDVFVAPMRLYIGPMHNNATGIGLKMDQVKLPVVEHITTFYANDIEQKAPNLNTVAPDSLEAYLGYRCSPTGAGYENVRFYKNALFHLMYWDIYKNYYANKQEEEGVVISPTKEPQNNLQYIFFQNLDNGSTSKQVTIQYNTILSQTEWGNRSFIKIQGPGDEIFQITLTYNQDVTEDNIKKTKLLVVRQENAIPNYELLETVFPRSNFNYVTSSTGEQLTLTSKTTGVGTDYYFPAGRSGLIYYDRNINYDLNLIRFPLKNIDDMRAKILATPIGQTLVINSDPEATGIPYNVTTQKVTDGNGKVREACSRTMCGLGIKTHLSDMFNNWLQTDWLDGENGVNDITAVNIVDGKFTMDELNFKQKFFNMMNRIAVQDGSYSAWETAVYGPTGPTMTESPIYLGGYSAEIAFDEVVSNAATQNEPLGSLAGRGATQRQTKKGGNKIRYRCNEASLVMVLVSFTPRVTYSQGNEWWTDIKNMDDWHKPDLDGIAFQELNTDLMLGCTERIPGDLQDGQKQSIGKQTSWVEYTTNVNKSFGDFAAGMPLEHMVINRNYQLVDYNKLANGTTYIDPVEFNTIFADQDLSAKPFWVQIGFDENTRRVMSVSQMPIM